MRSLLKKILCSKKKYGKIKIVSNRNEKPDFFSTPNTHPPWAVTFTRMKVKMQTDVVVAAYVVFVICNVCATKLSFKNVIWNMRRWRRLTKSILCTSRRNQTIKYFDIKKEILKTQEWIGVCNK